MSKTCERCVNSHNIDDMCCENKNTWDWLWCNKKNIFIMHDVGFPGQDFYVKAKKCLFYEEVTK